MRRHGCAATSAVTCAECCRVTSTMTATQVLTIGFALQYPWSLCGAPDAEATSGWEFSPAGALTAFQESGCPLLQTLCAYMRLRVIL